MPNSPEEITQVRPIVCDDNTFRTIATKEYKKPPALNELADTLNADYLLVKHLPTMFHYKAYINAHLLTPEEIEQQEGLTKWMSKEDIKKVVRTRSGMIVEFNEDDQILFSQRHKSPQPKSST